MKYAGSASSTASGCTPRPSKSLPSAWKEGHTFEFIAQTGDLYIEARHAKGQLSEAVNVTESRGAKGSGNTFEFRLPPESNHTRTPKPRCPNSPRTPERRRRRASAPAA